MKTDQLAEFHRDFKRAVGFAAADLDRINPELYTPKRAARDADDVLMSLVREIAPEAAEAYDRCCNRIEDGEDHRR